MSRSWWQRRSRNEKIIVIVLPILVLCIIIGVSVGVARNKNKDGSSSKPNSKDGTTSKPNSKLEDISELLMQSMDRNVDPCEDFYNFTCGRWAKATKIPKTASTDLINKISQDIKSAFDEKLNETNLPPAQAKLIDAYRSCLNIIDLDLSDDDVAEFQVMLDSVGGWPMADSRWDGSNYDVDIAIASAIKTTGVGAMLKFGVLSDDKNTSRNVINIIAPPPTTMMNNATKELLHFIARRFPRYSEEKFESDMKDVIRLESEIRQLIAASLVVRGSYPEGNGRTLKIKDLEKEIPGVDFVQFFQVITNASLNNMNEFLTKDDEIVIKNIAYFKGLAQLLNSSTSRSIANYVGAYIVLYTMGKASPVFEEQGYSIWQHSGSYAKAPGSWASCLQILIENMHYVTDRVYVDYLGISKPNEKASAMIDNLRQAFETLADQAKWLDKPTLEGVKVKLKAMRKFVGFVPWIKDDKKLDDYYETLPDMGPRFLPNLRQMSEFVIERMLRKLRELNDLNEWSDSSQFATTTVNAFYYPAANSITFPLGIQAYPFFYPDEETPWYMNFGAIGAVIGHEITHGFDSEGSKRDENGNIHNWWSDKSKQQFKEKAQCFIDQYSKFSDTQTGLNVNGTLTLPENIADNGGLRQAFLAYQNWERKFGKERPLPGLEMYTTHQLLFISYGNMWCAKYSDEKLRSNLKKDVHTPSPYRVWGVIANSKEFSDTFDCTLEATMNPKDKCVIW